MNIFHFTKKKRASYDSEKLEGLNIVRKKYSTYEDYLRHQAEKLDEKLDQIKQSDIEYEEVLYERFKEQKRHFEGNSMLCLGARLGGEVRAFKKLNMLAVGIDINTGEKNEDVLYGDFHNIKFPDNIFSFAFTNVIDHVYDLPRFCEEVYRILKPRGILYAECGKVKVKEDNYEVIDTTDHEPILRVFKEKFNLIDSEDIVNKTSYLNWEGKLYTLEKPI